MLKTLFEIYSIFFRIGLFTFGGGLAMLPLMVEELSTKRGWVTEDELLDYFSIGQVTPGIIAVNVSTFVGYKRFGVLGGVIGTLGIVTPSLIIIMVLATFISNIADIMIVQKALRGVNVAVASLLTCISIRFIKKNVLSLVALVELIISFFAVFVFNVHSIFIIIATLAMGLTIALIKRDKTNKKEHEIK